MRTKINATLLTIPFSFFFRLHPHSKKKKGKKRSLSFLIRDAIHPCTEVEIAVFFRGGRKKRRHSERAHFREKRAAIHALLRLQEVQPARGICGPSLSPSLFRSQFHRGSCIYAFPPNHCFLTRFHARTHTHDRAPNAIVKQTIYMYCSSMMHRERWPSEGRKRTQPYKNCF